VIKRHASKKIVANIKRKYVTDIIRIMLSKKITIFDEFFPLPTVAQSLPQYALMIIRANELIG
jgi:hypothetical protein